MVFIGVLIVIGDGEVYVWDLSRRVCIHKFRDEGCLSGTAVANSGRFIACGSRSGIVNIYDSAACMKTATPKPLKSVLNLTTRTDILAFNHDSQILLMASRAQRDHLKLLHTGSLSVFSNWPTASTPLRHVHASCFSPNSGYLAIGNDRGHALLYRLSHYDVS
ncbi:hypothetical protein Zmor_012233 [Zophobas morio]|uniref:Uncharacterized protein n=1 Tax=Zophobas morio TaxID=2755281 RepID=A0AA38HGE5_9CUCU|nr:hypothetical protein Zmor_012233 [Zophobas morio]